MLMESWRMFHGLAGQVEYVNALNTTLQDLVGFALERKTEVKNARKQKADEKDAALESDQSGDRGKTITIVVIKSLIFFNALVKFDGKV